MSININHIKELDRQYPISTLKEGLSMRDKIVWSENGNRCTHANVFLKKIVKIFSRLGATRIADISFLSPAMYPVYQSCRPNILFHSALGQNSGSQGKGATRIQAKISCIMETIEGYCAEPRKPNLIRASYNYLKHHQAVSDPKDFVQTNVNPVDHDEPLLWTNAFSIETDMEVLIPAELVYFPFVPELYHTRTVFPSGSNGLASGSTYLEAAVHGLYEVIERYYQSLAGKGYLHIEALYEKDLNNVGIKEVAETLQGEFDLRIYALEIPGIKNLPMFSCGLLGTNEGYLGYGCSSTISISLDRAISEALQSYATVISGTREDIQPVDRDNISVLTPTIGETTLPPRRTLRLKNYKRRVHDKSFLTLRQEYNFVVNWIHRLGFPKIFIANLTHIGIDIPVVKIVIPFLDVPDMYKMKNVVFGHDKIINYKFPNISLTEPMP